MTNNSSYKNLFKLFSKTTPNKKKRKKIYRFKYSTSPLYTEFHGYLNPSRESSFITIKRLRDHVLNTKEIKFDKITSHVHLRNTTFDNCYGVCKLTILFENTSNGIRDLRIGDNISTSPLLSNKVEKKIQNVLVLKESKVEFGLGNDFITDCNIEIEHRRNKGNFIHRLRFKDGATVDLEKTENVYDVYDDDEEEEEESSEEEGYEYDDSDENSVESPTISKMRNNNNSKIKNFFNRIGLSNFIIILLIFFIVILNNYTTPQSLVEELVVLPYNTQFTKPGIDNKLEDYIRRLRTTTSFLELFELDKSPSSSSSTTSPSPSSTSSSSSSSSSSIEGGEGQEGEETIKTIKGEEMRGQQLYSSLVKCTNKLDNTKRKLLDMYNQEISYFSVFQQNIKNLLKYISSSKKKKLNILFRIIPGLSLDESFPLTKNFNNLINDLEKIIINNTKLIVEDIIIMQNYFDDITTQVEKMEIELESLIKDNNIPFSSWLNALIRFSRKLGGKNIDILDEIDYETALKFKKLLIALDNDLFKLSNFFNDLKIYLKNHLSDLLTFFENFNTINSLTFNEIKIIKIHLIDLQNNRRIIFDENLVLNNNYDDDDDFIGCRIRENLLTIGKNVIQCSG